MSCLSVCLSFCLRLSSIRWCFFFLLKTCSFGRSFIGACFHLFILLVHIWSVCACIGFKFGRNQPLRSLRLSGLQSHWSQVWLVIAVVPQFPAHCPAEVVGPSCREGTGLWSQMGETAAIRVHDGILLDSYCHVSCIFFNAACKTPQDNCFLGNLWVAPFHESIHCSGGFSNSSPVAAAHGRYGATWKGDPVTEG